MSLRCLQSRDCFVLLMDRSIYLQRKHVIEVAKSEPRVPDLPPDDIADGAFRDRALEVDAMAVLQSMKKTATIHTLADVFDA